MKRKQTNTSTSGQPRIAAKALWIAPKVDVSYSSGVWAGPRLLKRPTCECLAPDDLHTPVAWPALTCRKVVFQVPATGVPHTSTSGLIGAAKKVTVKLPKVDVPYSSGVWADCRLLKRPSTVCPTPDDVNLKLNPGDCYHDANSDRYRYQRRIPESRPIERRYAILFGNVGVFGGDQFGISMSGPGQGSHTEVFL